VFSDPGIVVAGEGPTTTKNPGALSGRGFFVGELRFVQ
jgi:hypothetical protein